MKRILIFTMAIVLCFSVVALAETPADIQGRIDLNQMELRAINAELQLLQNKFTELSQRKQQLLGLIKKDQAELAKQKKEESKGKTGVKAVPGVK